jgi:hypothetical protein
MKVCSVLRKKERSSDFDKGMVVLQNCMDLPEVLPGSGSETCHDENMVISIKAEDVTDVQEDEHPLLITFPIIKAEQEVCVCVYTLLDTFLKYTNCLLTFLSLSIHMKQVPFGEWILKDLIHL